MPVHDCYKITHATLQADHVGENADDGGLLVISSATQTGCGAEGEICGPIHHLGPHKH